MDAEQIRIVIASRRAAQRDQARLVAWQVTEMRNLWSTGPRWSVAQTLGEEPAPSAQRSNDVAALGALVDEAQHLRAEQEQERAAGWADSFDGPDAAFDDADLGLDPGDAS
jgi:hypothetical protein